MKHFLLSILIVMLPIIANADESGTFSDNLNWSYEEATSTLTISGNGPMKDCYWYNVLTGSGYYVRPWSNSSSIQKVVIEEGITSIGTGYFWQCTQLTSVTIPNSVTSIGHGVFYSCSSLSTITIPNSVTSIGNSVFYGCSSLSTISIPNNVTSIGSSAFNYCTSLTSIIIPNSVTYIDKSAFSGCSSLSKVEFHCENIDDWFSGFTSLKEIIMGSEVISIEKNAFSGCSGLNSLSIPSSVTSIGVSAFKGCSGLNSLTLPSSVTSISNSAFEGCIGITSVIVLCSPTNIGSPYSASPFSNCPNIKEVSFDCEYVTSLFKGCSSIEKVNFSKNVTSIGESAFSGCRNLTSVLIPNNVISIGSYAFYNCCNLSSFKIPNSMTSIAEGAFAGCSGLLSIVIPNSVTSIGNEAFSDCSTLASVIIGNGVTSIGNNAFKSTTIKKTIWLTNTPPSGYTYAKGNINYVSNDQFSSLSNTVKYQFLSSYFDVDGIRYVPVSPSERTCDAIDCVYDESAANTKISSTVSYKGVTMNVKNIQPYLAYNNKYIKTLAVENDGELSNYAFTNCSNVQSVTLGQKVSAIGSYVFQGCSSLEAVAIPDIVTVLNDYTFEGCSSLQEVKLSSQLKTINQYAFGGCIALPSITIPSAVTNIYNYVFNGCTGLKTVNIADSESTLTFGSNGSNPIFASCPLDYVYIGRDINYSTNSSTGYSPFYRNTTLREVKITDKETEISENEFYGCTNLQKITIGDGVTTIGKRAFSGASSLKFFAFGSQVADIGEEAFSDCAAVIEITSKAATPPVCGSQALDDINKWDCKLYVPKGKRSAYQAADQWKDFFFSEEGEGTSEQNPDGQPTTGKCKTPKITIVDGKIHFSCGTKGVSYTYNISTTSPSGTGNNITPSSLTLKVYASKPGFEDSDVASKEIDINLGIRGDLNNDNSVNVADHVELSKIIMNQ